MPTTLAPLDGGADTITARIEGEQRRYVRDLFAPDRWWLYTTAGRVERTAAQVAHELTSAVFTHAVRP